MEIKKMMCVAAIVAGLAMVVSDNQARAQEFEASAEEYTVSCAPCHGADGTGNGYLVRESKGGIDAPDLTQLAKENGGIFPLPEVFMTIDGRNPIGAHGDRTMPIWGDRYRVRTGEEGLGAAAAESAVRARVLELVYYLQSIQTVHIPAPDRSGQ